MYYTIMRTIILAKHQIQPAVTLVLKPVSCFVGNFRTIWKTTQLSMRITSDLKLRCMCVWWSSSNANKRCFAFTYFSFYSQFLGCMLIRKLSATSSAHAPTN